MKLLMNPHLARSAGWENVNADVETYEVDEVTKWLKITNFQYS